MLFYSRIFTNAMCLQSHSIEDESWFGKDLRVWSSEFGKGHLLASGTTIRIILVSDWDGKISCRSDQSAILGRLANPNVWKMPTFVLYSPYLYICVKAIELHASYQLTVAPIRSLQPNLWIWNGEWSLLMPMPRMPQEATARNRKGRQITNFPDI